MEKLFKRLESSKEPLDPLLRALADNLAAHIAIEETIFYPPVRKLKPDIILESLEEHAMGRFALKRLLGTSETDASLRARLNALKELMTNHHREEERELFPRVRRTMPDKTLRELGRSMRRSFEANVKLGHEKVLATFADELKRPVRAKSTARAGEVSKTSRKPKKRAS